MFGKKQVEEGASTAAKGASLGIKAVKGALSVGGAVTRALPKGIRHPDRQVHRPELYVGEGNGGLNKSLMPTGRRAENWRDLYPGVRGGAPHPLGKLRRIPPLRRPRLF